MPALNTDIYLKYLYWKIFVKSFGKDACFNYFRNMSTYAFQNNSIGKRAWCGVIYNVLL